MKTKEEVKGARSTLARRNAVKEGSSKLEVKMTCQSELLLRNTMKEKLVEDYTTLQQAQGDMTRKTHKRGQVFHISHFISLILQTCI